MKKIKTMKGISLVVLMLFLAAFALAEQHEAQPMAGDSDDEPGNMEANELLDEVRERARQDLTEVRQQVKSRASERLDEVKEIASDQAREGLDRAQDRVEAAAERKIENLKENTREKGKEIRSEAREKIKEKGKDFVRESKERIREKAQSRKNLQLERYQEIKTRHKEAHDSFKEHRTQMKNLKTRANCTEDSEECKGHKKELKRGVRQHLIKTGDVIERSLEKLTNRVEAAEALSDEEKEAALASIAALEEELTAANDNVHALAEEASNEELRAAIKDLKETWKNIRKAQKRIVAQLMNAKLDHIIEKHDEYQNGMEMRIEQLKEQGVDTAKLEGFQEDFKDHLNDLKQQSSTIPEDDEEMKDFKSKHRESRENLKETRRVLRSFMQSYRELKTTG